MGSDVLFVFVLVAMWVFFMELEGVLRVRVDGGTGTGRFGGVVTVDRDVVLAPVYEVLPETGVL